MQALREHDRVGRDAFLHTYGFRPAHSYVLVHEGRDYDSKAIAGVAHGYQFPGQGPLTFMDFNGGKSGAAKLLTRLGFTVTSMPSPGVAADSARRASPPAVTRSASRPVVVLIGCVKMKLDHAAPAEELYVSPLFRKRRAFAESTGRPWFILSAQHGLIAPDQVLLPYDMRLSDQPSDYRDRWGGRVMKQLEDAGVAVTGETFELHAGLAYVDPLGWRLTGAGARVVWPFKGLSQGEHLAWHSASAPREVDGTLPSVLEAVTQLGDQSLARDTGTFPWADVDLASPGLYAWYVDVEGSHDLTSGLGHRIQPGLVYAGQAGAQQPGAQKENAATLRSRIGSQHLNGGIDSSTWRKALSAVLGLSQPDLSAWMRRHLTLITLPVSARAGLVPFEHAVLAELDPPLNLDAMVRNPVRARLSELRRRV